MSAPIRVLVADDNTDVLMAVAGVIQEFGGADVVSLTMTVEETVRIASWLKPDVAFIDAWLAGGGAEEAAKRMAELSPGTVVVALASARELELVLRLRAVGASCYDKEALSGVLPEILGAVSRR
jgi:two-component system, NarL family, response regulator LiaR